MNVYVESNFVLELSLSQEETESCEQIISICESGRAKLILPAYCLAEPNETLIRQDNSRKELVRQLNKELSQLARSNPYKTEAEVIQQTISLLRRGGLEERQRFTIIRERLLHTVEIISLNSDILASAAFYEKQFGLSPQDSLVFASILQHISASATESCFLTLNSKDFDTLDIREALARYQCEMKFKFSHGYNYIQSQL